MEFGVKYSSAYLNNDKQETMQKQEVSSTNKNRRKVSAGWLVLEPLFSVEGQGDCSTTL